MSDVLHISGLSVVVRPTQFDAAITAIEHLPGAEVFARDRATNRLVVVQDLPSVDEHVEGLRRIQALPQVLVAELVYHHSDGDEGNGEHRCAGKGLGNGDE